MKMDRPIQQNQQATYEILVQGNISQRWVDWFANMTILAEDEAGPLPHTTAEVRVADQAALLGQLQKLHNLGFSLLQVRRIG
jgi:hypothetical protein